MDPRPPTYTSADELPQTQASPARVPPAKARRTTLAPGEQRQVLVVQRFLDRIEQAVADHQPEIVICLDPSLAPRLRKIPGEHKVLTAGHMFGTSHRIPWQALQGSNSTAGVTALMPGEVARTSGLTVCGVIASAGGRDRYAGQKVPSAQILFCQGDANPFLSATMRLAIQTTKPLLCVRQGTATKLELKNTRGAKATWVCAVATWAVVCVGADDSVKLMARGDETDD
jgi:hypothetical protein